ncbi:hypothetical protein Q3G72_032732 [Acer saccharum]|nr:hypothetical protein Q3G72_032732 [Acer saccharum]
MALKLDGLINVLSYEKEVADLQAKLKSELNNVEGLSRLQLFRAIHMLAKDHDLLRVFFTMSIKEKKIYVMDLLKHGLTLEWDSDEPNAPQDDTEERGIIILKLVETVEEEISELHTILPTQTT